HGTAPSEIYPLSLHDALPISSLNVPFAPRTTSTSSHDMPRSDWSASLISSIIAMFRRFAGSRFSTSVAYWRSSSSRRSMCRYCIRPHSHSPPHSHSHSYSERVPAIDRDHGARNVTRALGAQEQHDVCHILRIAESAQYR